MQPSPCCSIQTELVDRLNQARKLYTSALHALDGLSANDFDIAASNIDAARLLYKAAQLALVDHRREHGC